MKRLNLPHLLFSFLVISSLLFTGCSSNSTASNTLESPTPKSESLSPSPLVQNTPQSLKKLPRLEGKATVLMIIKGSPVTIEVDGTNAPITAGNFIDLVQRGVYNGLPFHRVVREPQPFVVQGGDPKGKDEKVPMAQLGMSGFIDPATGSERRIPLEIKPKEGKEILYSRTFEEAGIKDKPTLRHTRGAVAMARAYNPDSASSQFYIALADLPFLDGSYAVFGNVKDGMDTVDKIQQGDRIESAKVTAGLENLK